MKPSPFVSVIIVSRNRAEMLEEAVESVLSQTLLPGEILVVDDGSEDDTRERMEKRSGILYFRQVPSGQVVARNLGLSKSRGEYVAFLDSDDLWKPRFLEEAVLALESLPLDGVFSDWTVLNGFERLPSSWKVLWSERGGYPTEVRGWFGIEPQQARRILLKACPAPTSAWVFRRSALPSPAWNEKLDWGEDWALQIDLFLRGKGTMGFTMEKLWEKRVGNDNLSLPGGAHRENLHKRIERNLDVLFAELEPLLTKRERRVFQGHYSENDLNSALAALRRETNTSSLSRMALESLCHPFLAAKMVRLFFSRRLSRVLKRALSPKQERLTVRRYQS